MEDLDLDPILTLDLAALSKAYDYRPEPVEKRTPLGVDWGDVTEQALDEIRDQVLNQGALSQRPVHRHSPFFYVDLLTKTVETSQGPLTLSVHVTKPTRSARPTDVLSLSVQMSLPDQAVANFLYNHASNTWELNHRIIEGPFRAQGLGSHVSKIAEGVIRAIAEETHQDQEIEASVGQADVLNFFLKQGYRIHPEDLVKYYLLQEASPDLVIVSEPGGSGRSWWVFPRSVYESKGDRVWDDPYVSDALQIRLQKTIESQVLRSTRHAAHTEVFDAMGAAAK